MQGTLGELLSWRVTPLECYTLGGHPLGNYPLGGYLVVGYYPPRGYNPGGCPPEGQCLAAERVIRLMLEEGELVGARQTRRLGAAHAPVLNTT